MKPEIINYCKSIGLTEPFIKRLEDLYEMIIEMIKEEPVEVLIEEYINGDGVRTYTDASFFCSKFCIEIHEFLNKDEITIFNFSKIPIIGIKFMKQDYDLKKATEKSRLNIQIIFSDSSRGNYKASKENCDHLFKIIKKYYFPLIG